MSEIQTRVTREGRHSNTSIVPAVDVIEDATGITLYADLAGVAKDKLRLQVEEDALIIEGNIDTTIATGIEAQHVEIDTPHYRRAFTLSKELDAEKISASLSNGVLKLHIPKAEHAQPKRINVTVN